MVLGLMVGAKVDEYVERTGPGEFRVVEADGELTSALRLDRQAQWWLGRALPSAQVLQLATPPQHRGAGHGARLLAGLLEELHADGVPLATLTPSNFPFYRGAGFEVAGSWTWYEARAEHLPKRTAPYRARPVSLEDPAELAAVYRRVAPSRHGALDRDERFWEQVARRSKDKTMAAFVLDGPDGPAGWAVATLEFRPEPAPFQTRIEIADWGCLPGADAALFALFAGYASMNGMVAWSGPDPDPAAIYALEDNFARLTDRWHWMLRLVDLPAALQARPWPAGVGGQVSLRVEDPACPWNTGTWRLELANGQGRVERAPGSEPGSGSPSAGARVPGSSSAESDPAAPAADIRGLASLFTGFATPDDLLRIGLLRGFDPGAVELLRAAFASPRPWTAEFY
jgi:predicted acetyltransferase